MDRRLIWKVSSYRAPVGQVRGKNTSAVSSVLYMSAHPRKYIVVIPLTVMVWVHLVHTLDGIKVLKYIFRWMMTLDWSLFPTCSVRIGTKILSVSPQLSTWVLILWFFFIYVSLILPSFLLIMMMHCRDFGDGVSNEYSFTTTSSKQDEHHAHF